MPNETESSSEEQKPQQSRSALLQDVIEFQLKLFVDGIRDFLLVPISLTAALVDFLMPPGERNHLFYRVMRMGKDSESWIDLFGALRRVESDAPNKTPQDDPAVDTDAEQGPEK